MSTEHAIAHGEGFYFYREIFEEDALYLELSGVAFEAGKNWARVPIPVPVWELVRRYQAVDYGLLEMTDAEPQARVAQEVGACLALAAGPRRRVGGALKFGKDDASREQQIAGGLDWCRERRARSRAVKTALDALVQQNPRLECEPPVIDGEP